MSKLVVLQPVSRMAQRLTDGESISTVAGEALLPNGCRSGPLCPICGRVMVAVTADAHLVACPNDECVYARAPFRSPVAATEARNEPVAAPV